MANSMLVFVWMSLASGFGTGFIKIAPGTFGTSIGFIFWCGLVAICSPVSIILSVALFFLLSVFLSGWAAKRVGEKDPQWVVVDEWSAFIFVLSPWPLIIYSQSGEWPSLEIIFSDSKSYLILFVYFLTFRLFDIFKPLGISKLQNFPGGWGITLDDYAAAIPASIIGSLCLLYC